MPDIELKKLRDFDDLTISETDKREARKNFQHFKDRLEKTLN